MKYEYRLYTWGGFYNKHNRDVHNEPSGAHYFSTLEERQDYKYKLLSYSQTLLDLGNNDSHLVFDESEGYNCRTPVTLHRVIKFKGKEYHSYNELVLSVSFETAKYHLETKWYPGFNDYPLGEDFDYELVETVQEWITGSFAIDEEGF